MARNPQIIKIKNKTLPKANQVFYDYRDPLSSSLFERKVNLATDGLQQRFPNLLLNKKMLRGNAPAVVDFILNMNTEINLSDSHRINILNLLSRLSDFHNNKKPFKEIQEKIF